MNLLLPSLSLLSVLFLASCSFESQPPTAIPGPAPSVSRQEAIEIAYRYSKVRWMPEERHRHHGPDAAGIIVHTPDTTLSAHGSSRGWWQPGKKAVGVPYQWGGFDTPDEFLASIEKGEFAGDISNAYKRRLDDHGTSRQACGIDCSGFVSRCWRLSRPYSTRELPRICRRISWAELQAGDILLKDGHVILFSRWSHPGSFLYAYEAGPYPVWRVNAAEIPTETLVVKDYQPWRYRAIRD